jgi:hypothetical protein
VLTPAVYLNARSRNPRSSIPVTAIALVPAD